MIITERFVFIHMHRTGGQALNDIIEHCVSDYRVIGNHYPRSEVPDESAALPVIGMVRNPWDWYVSWYHFNRQPDIRNPLFNVVSDDGQADFKSTVTNLINLGSNLAASKAYRDELVRILPNSLDGDRSVGFTKGEIRDFSSEETGYYSWLFGRMFGSMDAAQIYIGKFENLCEDFFAIMKQQSVEETETIKAEFDKRERKNVSRHSHYSHYYDDELRDLIGKKERLLIEKYDYKFESIRPFDIAYDVLDAPSLGPNGRFRKLLGRENSYLLLHNEFDVEAIRNRVERIPAATWLESGREKLFDVHKYTQSLQLVHFEDFKHEQPVYRELYDDLRNELEPLLDYIATYYQNNGFVVRLLLAKLLAGGNIKRHTDAGYSLLNCHRIHVPLITNDKVVFVIGGEEKKMRVGELWEINNSLDHAVDNRSSEDRIHLIVDWMPNYDGKPQAEVLMPGLSEGVDRAALLEAKLYELIANAQQIQQSGRTVEAESLYRQVLHIDENHVIANNLLGLLCLHAKRFDEAAALIETALAVMPDDAQAAQAHANLGLALNGLNRPEEAVDHLQESLKLAPSNFRAYNNLGAICIALHRTSEAITCYEKALAIQPANAVVQQNLGIARRALSEQNS